MKTGLREDYDGLMLPDLSGLAGAPCHWLSAVRAYVRGTAGTYRYRSFRL